MPFRWHIDQINCRRVAGWVDNGGPAAVDISINGRAVATIAARDYREDLEDAGIGDGCRSFTFPLARYLVQPNNDVVLKCNGRVLASTTVSPISEEARIAALALAAEPTKMQTQELMFLQTADPKNYRRMLQTTSRTVIEYCGRHNVPLELFFGVCRGHAPWHAAFNRIVLLRRLLNNGFSGWVCYLDADAYIADLGFDLRKFLADKNELALIIAIDNPFEPNRPYWRMNDGVFFINLGHPVGREIVWQWGEELDDRSELLKTAAEWSFGDQALLIDVLRALPNGPDYVLTLRENPSLINGSAGLFIRQIVRADMPQREREEHLRFETDRVLSLL